MRTFSLAPQRKKYPTAVVDGLRGRRISRPSGDVVSCVRCLVEVAAKEWPFHGSLDSNRCVSPWEKQAMDRAAAAKANKRKAKR